MFTVYVVPSSIHSSLKDLIAALRAEVVGYHQECVELLVPKEVTNGDFDTLLCPYGPLSIFGFEGYKNPDLKPDEGTYYVPGEDPQDLLENMLQEEYDSQY